MRNWCHAMFADWQVRDLFEVAGKSQALGPLDENMEEDDEELDEEEGGDEELTALLSRATIA